MEAHAENSSDKNNPNTESESLLSLKNFLFVTTRGSIKWVDNIDSLKRFMDDLLNTETKWQSRGGYKLYESPFPCNSLVYGYKIAHFLTGQMVKT